MLTRRRFGDESGVTIILFALLLVILLGITGTVLDFGLVRADRQRNKSASDVAVTAGLQALNFSGLVAPFRGACAAVDYLKANHPELSALSSASGTWTDGRTPPTPVIGGDPCTSGTVAYAARRNQLCRADPSAARATYAWFTTTVGSIDVKVRAGYSQSDLTSGGFGDEAGHSDTGSATQYGCDQLAVIITEREKAGFGRVLGGDVLESTIRSVGRVEVTSSNLVAIGLLLLERNDCGAADLGSSTSKIAVIGSGTQPGLIHADSVGDGTDCNSKKVLNGQYTTPGVRAGRSPDGSKPGVITTAAALGTAAQQANAVTGPGTVVAENTIPATSPAPEPGGRGPVGRIAVDSKYRAAVADLRSEAAGYFALTAAPAGWRSTGCNPNAADLADTASAGIWVDCDGTFGPAGITAFQNANVVFTGNINLVGGGGRSIQFPNADKVYVKGSATGGVSINAGSTGSMTINTGTSSTCDDRRVAAPSKFARLVIGSGGLDLSSSAMRMCQTFVFLMDGSRIYDAGEPPSDNGFKGKINVSGGGGLEWTAPNTVLTAPTAAQMAASPFEDLALWTETSANSAGSHTITGGGTMKLKGVFFAPNANAFKFAGGGDGNIAANAQFIVRKLFVTGGANLSLTADPENSVLVQSIGGYRLVR